MRLTKERIFYLDFIRAIATLSIVLIHYNALFLYLPEPKPEKCILSADIFNIYLGAWGVSLFFIISGAALMYTYESNFSTIKFYKKRIISVYPMWWLAYAVGLSYVFLRYRTYNQWGVTSHEGWKILLSIFGFDQYFASITTTFSIVGEWFLGCIILLYIIFPLLRKIVLNPKTLIRTIPIFLVLYFVGIYSNVNPLPATNKIFVRVPEFLFGMFFIKYIKNPKIQLWGTGAVLVLIMNTILRPDINMSIQTTYIGIASFICLVCIAHCVRNSVFLQVTTSIICKYSYAIYLCHHLIIYQVAGLFDLNNISRVSNYVLFFVTCEIIALFSVCLYKMERILMRAVAEIKDKHQNAHLS